MSTGTVERTFQGIPPDGQVEPLIVDKTGSYAAWELGWETSGHHLVVTTFGGTCSYFRVETIARTGPQAVTVTTKLVGNPATTCTANLVARTADLIVPPGITSRAPLRVLIFTQHLVLPAKTSP